MRPEVSLERCIESRKWLGMAGKVDVQRGVLGPCTSEGLLRGQCDIAAGSAAIPRRDPTDRDVQIEILYCGICHSDLHSVRNEWSEFLATTYPIVPGHEIVGRVTKVGSAVDEVQGGRPGGRRLPGGLGPHLPELSEGLRTSART